MKSILVILFLLPLYGCTAYLNKPENLSCLGNTHLPKELKDKFEPVVDKKLLHAALGKPDKGGLCQGRVYKSKSGTKVKIFRGWNSTNPSSQFSNWWVFQEPRGKISTYRSEYEICYKWTPLDKLEACTLKPDVKIVLGTGQSAKCSKYLTYPISDKQQIYIDNASISVDTCKTYDGMLSWK